MPGRMNIRGLVAFVLAAALFFHVLPRNVRAETLPYRPVESLEELVTGQYVPVINGYAPGVLEEGWLTAAEPTPETGLWTLQVEEDGVLLRDSSGAAIAPGADGLTAGEARWTVRCEQGRFSFHCLLEGEPVTLAANVYAANRFRAYPEALTAAEPEIYPSGFALYRLEAQPEPTEETAPSTEAAALETTAPEETVPKPPELPWKLCFGRFHAHSGISDGTETVETLFARAREAGLDFYAVTDHSDSFDNAAAGAIGVDGTGISTAWAGGKAAAAQATDETFLGLYGYEMSWPRTRQLGHLVTLGTPGWQSRDQEGFAEDPAALTNYYDALTTVPGSVSQFCHPGEDTGNFEGFSHWSPANDRAVKLLEIGGEEGFCLESYLLALERGWHVAPSAGRHVQDSVGTARTVVLAKELTEQALLEAVSQHRAYATMDEDLGLSFTLNGRDMGSVIPASAQAEIAVTVYDPTDSIGAVEVIGEGGAVLAAKTVEGHSAQLDFSLTGSEKYYFLRITQPDGDLAVTAPVWLQRATDMGIADFAADTQVPTRGKALSLTLSLYNQEAVDFCGETAVFSIGGEVIHAVNLDTIPGGERRSYTFSYAHPGLGITDIRAVVTGTVAGEPRTYERVLTLRFRMEDTLRHLLVDGTHGAESSYDHLVEIAAGENIGLTVAEEITEDLLERAQLLLIPAGTQALEPEFLALAGEFVKNGGNLILCGRADARDTDLHWSAEGNKLLKALGLSLRLCDDTAVDDVHNGGTRERPAAQCNAQARWCRGISPEQVYHHTGSCTVTGGTWLVRGFDTAGSEDADGDGRGGGTDAVLLAAEDSRWGGHVFVAGGDFLSDELLPRQANYWDPASINQEILETLLDIERAELPLSRIRAARESGEGAVVRISGYVTAGTANQYTRFPDLIYLQDETGGIAVTAFRDAGIQVGTPLELIGYRTVMDGNPALHLMEYRILDKPGYRFDPDNSRHADAMDYAENGGCLLQVEGVVKAVEYTADGKGAARISLEDARGDLAEILIEDCIFSGATGKNTLASQIQKGRTVRARGILHLDEGGAPVLRVRNCDEVVYLPVNLIPKTGDAIGLPLAAMMLSGTMLLTMKKRKKPDG